MPGQRASTGTGSPTRTAFQCWRAQRLNRRVSAPARHRVQAIRQPGPQRPAGACAPRASTYSASSVCPHVPDAPTRSSDAHQRAVATSRVCAAARGDAVHPDPGVLPPVSTPYRATVGRTASGARRSTAAGVHGRRQPIRGRRVRGALHAGPRIALTHLSDEFRATHRFARGVGNCRDIQAAQLKRRLHANLAQRQTRYLVAGTATVTAKAALRPSAKQQGRRGRYSPTRAEGGPAVPDYDPLGQRAGFGLPPETRGLSRERLR